MAQQTPSQTEAMEIGTTNSKDIKVNVGYTGSLPTFAKLAHVLAITVAAVIALCVSAVLSDGMSVIKVKEAKYLDVITDPSMKKHGIDHRVDELLGPTYGIGLHHDESGRTWTAIGAQRTLSYLVDQLGLPAVGAALPHVIWTDDMKHPVPFLECNDLKMAGMAAMSFGFIAEGVAVVMVIFHGLVLAGLIPSSIGKPFAGLVWLVLSAGFLIVVCLAINIYYATWTCNNVIIPSIKLSEHFDYAYGFALAVIGFIAAVLTFVVTLTFTSTKDGTAGASQAAPSIVKTLAGVTTGLAIGAIAAVVLLSSNDGFNATKEKGMGKNYCEGQKPKHSGPGDHYFSNTECLKDQVTQTLEQAGANVTRGYKGLLDVGDRVPITSSYDKAGLCPVNVHWHLGAEHLSVGEYDETGTGPASGRRLAGEMRLGFRCKHYKATEAKFTTPFNWQYCTDMHVGETYEIHWPHSAAGACGTKYQYQTPFYDGVFCNDGIISIAPLNTYKKIGVQSQIFTVVNDENYYYPDLFKGMIVDGDKGTDMAMYTGSTTGTSRDNNMCSRYTPVTWQVDRKCHLISASSFDKLCKDMKEIPADDMKGDTHPHGSRELVASQFVANNQQSRK